MTLRVIASALSGAAWGGLAWMLVPPTPGSGRLDLTFALLASPVIGIAVGELARLLTERHVLYRLLASIAFLFLAVGLFAALVPVTGWRDWPFESVGLFWGALTLGFAWILWPLAFANCQLIWRIDEHHRAAVRARR